MKKSRLLVFAAAAAFTAASVMATDGTLLNLIPPDAKIVAGVQVDTAKASPFGQYVLSHIGPGDSRLQALISATGFDPRKDISEILMASANLQTRDQGLILARGVFDPAKIQSAVQTNGGVASTYLGVNVYSGKDNNGALALPGPSLAILGDIDSVKAAIGRYRSNAPVTSALEAKVQTASAGNDFWFVTTVPLSEIAPNTANSNVNGAMQGNTFQSVQQASGGVRFGDPVQLAAELVMRSDKDAEAIANVIRFLASMMQMNAQKSSEAAGMATLLNQMILTTKANVTDVALQIPEAQLEKLLNSAQQHKAPAR